MVGGTHDNVIPVGAALDRNHREITKVLASADDSNENNKIDLLKQHKRQEQE